MKKFFTNFLMAIIIVCAIFMLVSFFVTFPKWLVIGGTILLIVAIALLLLVDKDKKEKEDKEDKK